MNGDSLLKIPHWIGLFCSRQSLNKRFMHLVTGYVCPLDLISDQYIESFHMFELG